MAFKVHPSRYRPGSHVNIGVHVLLDSRKKGNAHLGKLRLKQAVQDVGFLLCKQLDRVDDSTKALCFGEVQAT